MASLDFTFLKAVTVYSEPSAGSSGVRTRLSSEWGLWSEWGSKETHPSLYFLHCILLDATGSMDFHPHQEVMQYPTSSPLESYHERSRGKWKLSLLSCSHDATHSPATVVAEEDMWRTTLTHRYEKLLSVSREDLTGNLDFDSHLAVTRQYPTFLWQAGVR